VGLLVLAMSAAPVSGSDSGRIRPYSKNPRYWQYEGQPVLLLGGSRDDNLFQIPNLKAHLDALRSAGGNVIRNTMSDRQDFGFELYPYHRLEEGRYDLDVWNERYWERFENLLRWTAERKIIVQVEVWDRFDYSQQHWAVHPYNPANNVNYTPHESGLATAYPAPAWRDRQPFFHSIPGMPGYQAELDRVRHYQERFVTRLLNHSLGFGHVLYCMNNETSTPVEWGQYWMQFIRRRAAKEEVSVFVTDMFDDVWRPRGSTKLRYAFDHPQEYAFLDISQVNSRTFDEDHWENVIWIARQLADSPRPMNHTKIYSDGEYPFGTGTPVDGVERFWRNLLAGAASCRFHRPDAGIGLNAVAKACIASARKVESLVPFWEAEPRMALLSDRESDEAYFAADSGRHGILFFTDGGRVTLDLRDFPSSLDLRWVNVASGSWGPESPLSGGRSVSIEAPGPGPWVGCLVAAGDPGALESP
jgi:hypothetical protein